MIDDCWNKIGVRGDGSCPSLEKYANCYNCPVYASAAAEVLRTTPPDTTPGDRNDYSAVPAAHSDSTTASVLIFRIATEWLALATTVVSEVTDPKPIHALPHRSGGAVLGLSNVRGQLLVSLSLSELLGLRPASSDTGTASRTEFARVLVLHQGGVRIACPVDEVRGVQRFQEGTLRDVPATLAKATTRYSTKLLPWNGYSVGVLDDQLLFYSVKRSIA